MPISNIFASSQYSFAFLAVIVLFVSNTTSHSAVGAPGFAGPPSEHFVNVPTKICRLFSQSQTTVLVFPNAYPLGSCYLSPKHEALLANTLKDDECLSGASQKCNSDQGELIYFKFRQSGSFLGQQAMIGWCLCVPRQDEEAAILELLFEMLLREWFNESLKTRR